MALSISKHFCLFLFLHFFKKNITFIHVPIVYVLFILVFVVGGGCVCVCTNANPITCGVGARNQLVGLVLYFHHAGSRD